MLAGTRGVPFVPVQYSFNDSMRRKMRNEKYMHRNARRRDKIKTYFDELFVNLARLRVNEFCECLIAYSPIAWRIAAFSSSLIDLDKVRTASKFVFINGTMTFFK